MLIKCPRMRYVQAHVLAPIGLPYVLLAHPDPRTTMGLQSSIFDDDYSYFSNKYEEACHIELSDLAYHTRRASAVLALGAVGQGKVILPDSLRWEKQILQEWVVDAIIVEKIRCLEKIQEMSSSFIGVEVVMDPFAYPNTLVEKVKLLAQEVPDKNAAQFLIKHYYLGQRLLLMN